MRERFNFCRILRKTLLMPVGSVVQRSQDGIGSVAAAVNPVAA
jgi:hypothetical protein